MEKILRLAEASVLLNNFTALLLIIFTLHLANIGTVSQENPTLLSLATLTLGLHLAKLFFHILKKQSSGDLSREVVAQLGLASLPVASSLVVKIVSLLTFLSSTSSYIILYACLMFVLALAATCWIQKKFLADDTEEEEKKTFLRAAHSMIFPILPELATRKQVLGVTLQLLVGNIAAAILGFSVPLGEGVAEDLFITQNMVKAFGITIAFLIPFSTLAYYSISLLAKSSAEPLPTDDLDEDIEDLSESTPLLGDHNRPSPKLSLKKAAYALVLLLMSILILLSWYPLLLYQFNTCPPFSPTTNSHIRCDKTPQTYATTCHLSCSPLFLSHGLMNSTCSLTGRWTVADLTCRPQVAAVLGQGYNATTGRWEQSVDLYPATHSKSHIPGLPFLYGKDQY
jgi:hypothetical protein